MTCVPSREGAKFCETPGDAKVGCLEHFRSRCRQWIGCLESGLSWTSGLFPDSRWSQLIGVAQNPRRQDRRGGVRGRSKAADAAVTREPATPKARGAESEGDCRPTTWCLSSRVNSGHTGGLKRGRGRPKTGGSTGLHTTGDSETRAQALTRQWRPLLGPPYSPAGSGAPLRSLPS